MAKESALYQLMGVRMNDIMNDITNSKAMFLGKCLPTGAEEMVVEV